jgi:recombination protein RecA
LRTGIHALDLIMGAGIPRGRFIEVLGEPATTKTGFALEAAAAFQRAGGVAIYLEPESKLDRAWAERLGVDVETLGYDRPEDLPHLMRIVGKVAKSASPKIPVLIAVDSFAATPGAEELDELVSEDGMQSEKAARARYLSAAFRASLMELSRKGVTLLGINQLRTTFNFFTGRSGQDSPGGRALKYHAGVRIMFRNRGRLKDRTRDVITGIAVEAEAIKNTCAVPFRKAVLRFRFETGFVRWSGVDELLIRHGRLTSAAGWLRYKDRKFRVNEIESVAAELPELLGPIQGSIEDPPQVEIKDDQPVTETTP